MRDRLSTKILSNGATRYGVYDETGNLLRYEYIKLEDEPTVEGDLFSKANMLPDSIPAALGLKMGNPQVKDALNVLANIGNVHVWQRVQTYADPVPEVPAGYTLGAVETDVLLVSKAGETSVSISYSDSISVDANGNVSLASVNTISYVISEWREHYSVLQGKFCQVMDSTSGGITDAGASIFFFPSDAILEYAQAANYKLTLTAKKYQSVTGYPYTPAIPAGTTTDYLTSTDRNAYPDNVTDAQDAYYTLGEVVTGSFYMGIPRNSYQNTYTYSSSLSVSGDGTVSLANPSTATSSQWSPLSTDAINSTLVGKFVQWTCQDPNNLDTKYPFNASPSPIIFIPSDAKITVTTPDSNERFTLSKYQPVTGHAAIPANTTITYLGQLGGGTRIEVGSYVGTGTYGSSNKCSISFNSVPKMVFLGPSSDYGGVVKILWPGATKAGSYYNYNSSSLLTLTWSDDNKTVSWYGSDTENQCNKSGQTYRVYALI